MLVASGDRRQEVIESTNGGRVSLTGHNEPPPSAEPGGRGNRRTGVEVRDTGPNRKAAQLV
jgi:hypothetical protein